MRALTQSIRKQVNRLLASTADDNQRVTAACLHAMHIVSRVEHGESLPDELAAVKRRLDALDKQPAT